MNKKVIFCLLALILLAASWSLFHPNFFRVHDYTHAARIAEMSRALADGHFPVRWTKNFGYGFGMPLFEFYAPLPYYFGSLIYYLSNDIILTLKLLYLTTNLGTLVGAYKLGQKIFRNDQAAILMAAALVLAPYRAVNLFVRGALSEAWGIMAIPLILLAVVSLLKQEKNAWRSLVFSLVLLFLSHNILALITMPFIFGFYLLYLLKIILIDKKRFYVKNKDILKAFFIKVNSQFIFSLLLAFGMSSFYLLPAYFEKGYTQVENLILTLYFNYQLHFLYIRQFFNPSWGFEGSEWGPNDKISFFLGGGQLLALFVTVIIIGYQIYQYFKTKKHSIIEQLMPVIIFNLLLIISLYMSLYKSLNLWNLISILRFVQFPWRFLSLAIIFLSLNVGWSFIILKKSWRKYYFMIIFLLLILGNFFYFRPQSFLTNPENYYYTDEIKIQKSMSSILPDYIPQGMSKAIEEIPKPQPLILNETPANSYQILINKTQEKLIETKFGQIKVLNFNIANFPGWEAELDGEKIPVESGFLGNIQVTIPAGEHLVGVKLGTTRLRQLSDLISLFSVFGLLFLMIEFRNNKKIKNN